MECSSLIDPDFGPVMPLQIYYRYDAANRFGGVLRAERTADGWTLRNGKFDRNRFQWEAPVELKNCPKTNLWHFELKDSTLVFEGTVLKVQPELPESGKIGFDTKQHIGTVYIESIRIWGTPAVAEECFPERTWEFPQECMLPMSRWKFSFSAENRGGATVLSARISGGPTEALNRHIFYTKLLPDEILKNPWIQIVNPDGTIREKQYLFYGTIGFREHWTPMLPTYPRTDTECPVSQTFYLERLAPGSRLVIGFDRYEAEDRQQFAGIRKRMLADPFTGKILAYGDVPDESGLSLSVDSGAAKKICKMIPENAVDRESALRYAASNHYFFDDEAEHFSVNIDYPEKRYALPELEFHVVLENAYHETIREIAARQQCCAGNFPGESRICLTCTLEKLPVGVYHLRIIILAGGKTLKSPATAFEVFGTAADAPTPQQAAGLPEMMSTATDFQSESNVFDPRGTGSDDLAHYFGISAMQIMPAEERREWELLKVYRRRYFGWFSGRSAPDVSPEVHREFISHTDYYAPALGMRLLLFLPENYQNPEIRGQVLEVLREQGAEHSGLAAKVADSKRPFDRDMLRELFQKYGTEWVLRAAKWNQKKKLADFRKKFPTDRKLCDYGLISIYTCRLKNGFTHLLHGNDMRTPPMWRYSGFIIYEDYTLLVGSSPLSSLYTLAASALDAPGLKYYPEIYGLCDIPMDPSTVYGCPPNGYLKTEIFRKRFFDYKFTLCWYRDGAFHYWKDDGFHVRNPSRADMEEVLSAWGEIRKFTPEHPLRTVAFVTGTDTCIRHRCKTTDFQLWDREYLDVYNTAEEFPAWIQLETRKNGLPNGFTIRPEELNRLTCKDIHTLVLPPLDALTEEAKREVRRLYDSGVNLVCSECADGLEDLFGVKPCAPRSVRKIADEIATVDDCAAGWVNTDSEVLLSDNAGTPLLTLKRGAKAFAAFYTFAPTTFSRCYVVYYADLAGTVLPESAENLFRRIVPETEVSVSEGRIAAFRDRDGSLGVCVMEDNQPMPATAIDPVLTVRGDHRAGKINSDAGYAILERSAEKTVLKLHLKPFGSQMFRFA